MVSSLSLLALKARDTNGDGILVMISVLKGERDVTKPNALTIKGFHSCL
jgi:hypothetical protein